MYGYMGKFLRVDLASGKHAVQPVEEDALKLFLGGRGLATHIYMREADPGIDPLSDQNKIVLCTGPLVGTGAVSAASCYVVSKSPLTGTLACAKTRGSFGAEFKFAGYDGLIIEGRSEAPVVLSLMDGKVRLKPAPHLWGRTTSESIRVFKEEIGDEWGARETRMAVIGPAGEHQLPIATLVNEGFLTVGGAGLGAVFGAKNLKGIAVKGQNSILLADGAKLVQVVTAMINKLNGSLITSEIMPQWGTAFLVRMCNQKGMFPRNNFQSTATDVKTLGTDAISEAFSLKSRGCFSCPIACLKKTDMDHPLCKGEGAAPGFMAISSLGANCGINDLKTISRAYMLCTEMGLDPLAAGGLFATAMELAEKRRISADDVKLELKFGEAEEFLKGLELVSTKKGYGRRLGMGGHGLAEEHGLPDSFMGVKKGPVPCFDPRAIQGLGLHFATSNHGPHQIYGYTFMDELLDVRQSMDPFETESKPELVKEYQDMAAVMDSLGFCNWVLLGLKFSNLVPMTNAVLGTSHKAGDLMEIGERVWNLERLFNRRAGLGKEDDALPRRLISEPMPSGPAKGRIVPLDQMLAEYYRLRGWDDQGQPTTETLTALGL